MKQVSKMGAGGFNIFCYLALIIIAIGVGMKFFHQTTSARMPGSKYQGGNLDGNSIIIIGLLLFLCAFVPSLLVKSKKG